MQKCVTMDEHNSSNSKKKKKGKALLLVTHRNKMHDSWQNAFHDQVKISTPMFMIQVLTQQSMLVPRLHAEEMEQSGNGIKAMLCGKTIRKAEYHSTEPDKLLTIWSHHALRQFALSTLIQDKWKKGRREIEKENYIPVMSHLVTGCPILFLWGEHHPLSRLEIYLAPCLLSS